MMRLLLILALILAPIGISWKFAEHHEHENVFQLLFMHVMPAALVTGGHEAPEEAGAGHGAPGEHGAPAAAHGAHGEAPHYLLAIELPAALSAFGMNTAEKGLGEHWTPKLVVTNLQLFQVSAVLLCLVCFSGVATCIRTGKGDYVSRLFAGWALWIRDEMVIPTMGRERGRAYTPYFFTIFFFIVFMNLMGLVPGGATATASVFVTAAMALITFGSMLVCGMVVQGPVAFWKNLLPHGLPLPLIPLMMIVEGVGLLVKPFALAIRLFANMTGGHLVVLSLMGLIFYFGGRGATPTMGYATAPPILALAVFIMIIESFVALLQAYIFTQLSIIFVNQAVHPEH